MAKLTTIKVTLASDVADDGTVTCSLPSGVNASQIGGDGGELIVGQTKWLEGDSPSTGYGFEKSISGTTVTITNRSGGTWAAGSFCYVSLDTVEVTAEPKGRDINIQTADYTLADSDCGKTVVVNSGSAVVITIAKNLMPGFHCRVVRLGAGTVTLTPASGVTRSAKSTHTTISGQYGEVMLTQVQTNVFLMSGDTAA